ncbi:MAG: ABC transporter substrate-binding protein [Dehalococcoidia bacterium]
MSLRVLSLLILCSLACSATGSPALPGLQPAPDRAVIAVQNLPPTLDPHAFAALSPRRYGLFEALTAIGPTGALEPALARSWEMIDPTTWRFRLTERRFHDGATLTTESVKASFDRALDPANKLPIAARAATVRDARIIDDTTIDVITSVSDPLLPKRLSQVAILPTRLAVRPDGSDWSSRAIGSGPYRLKEWAPNAQLSLEAADHPARPAIRSVVIRQINDGAARLAVFQRGDVDAIAGVPSESAETLRSAGATILSGESGISAGMLLDATATPLRDVRVRQALNYAIDKEAIVRTVYHGAATVEPGQPVGPATNGFNPSLQPYPHDPARAKTLLAEAGASSLALRLDLFVNGSEVRETALLVQSQLAAVGVVLDVQIVPDQAAYLDRLYGRTPRGELTSIALLSVPLLDAEPVLQWFVSTAPAGLRRHANADLDAAALAASTEQDQARRRQSLQQALAILRTDPAYLFLVQPHWLWASRGLAGLEPRADNEIRPELLRKGS